MVYLPISVQRRTAEAVIVPFAILAAYGLERALSRLRPTFRPPARVAALGLASLSSLFLIATTMLGVSASTGLPTHIPAAALDAFTWLNANAPADSVVLSVRSTGSLLPVYASVRTFVGHGPETRDVEAKQAEAERFFSGALSADERGALYRDFDIAYVFYGPAERALAGADADAPAWAADLTLVYDRDGYRIYAIPAARGGLASGEAKMMRPVSLLISLVTVT